MDSSIIDGNDIIKKEAIGISGNDLGEVQEVNDGIVLIEKGLINKKKYGIPLQLIKDYDGEILLFNITEDESSNKYLVD